VQLLYRRHRAYRAVLMMRFPVCKRLWFFFVIFACVDVVAIRLMSLSDGTSTTASTGILHILLKLDAKVDAQSSELLYLRRESSEMRRSIQSLESRCSAAGESPGFSTHSAPSSASRSCDGASLVPLSQSEFVWICPVCLFHFTHRESFKGHIRQMMHHVRCVWSATNVDHVALVSKFAGDNFEAKASSFSHALYAEVCACTSSLDTEQQSYAHIFNWIGAAMSQEEGVALPRFNIGNRKERKRRGRSVSTTDMTSSSSRSRSQESNGS
jgi:hypothetical protein